MAQAFSGTIPAEASADAGALFEGLLEFQWRGIGFPVVDTELELRQDLAIHKFTDKDGAHIEGTGRAPLQITARIPFINNLTPALNERWAISVNGGTPGPQAGTNNNPLYPVSWRAFFEACADRSSGVLQHPELGELTCKCETALTRWSSDVRGGVYVNATWIETDDGQANLTKALAASSPIAEAQAAAVDLDTKLSTFDPSVLPQPFVPTTSFSDFVFAVRAVSDQTALFQKKLAGRIDNIVYNAQTVEDSLDRNINANSLNWSIAQACERAKSAAYNLKASLLVQRRPTAFYLVAKDSTLSEVANDIGASIVDVMSLNPAFVQRPIVAKGSSVRYYTAA